MANIFEKINGVFERKAPPIPGQIPGLYTPYPTSSRTLPMGPVQGPVRPQPTPQDRLLETVRSQTPPPAPVAPATPAPTTPTIPTSTPTPAPITQGTTTQNPYDAFNLLLQESLKAAQKIDTTDLLKQQRVLQREAIARTQGTGPSPITEEERKFLSPTQQTSMRKADIGALSPDLDEVAYQITRAEQDRKNLLEQIKFARESGDKMRERELADQKQAFEEQKFAEETRRWGLDYALKSRETALKEDEKITTSTGKEAEALSTMNLIGNLIANPGVKTISGFVQGFLGLGTIAPSSDAQLARNQFNQIKGMLALENRQKLKGQGAVSDFEGRTLERAASSLDRNLGDAEFINQLQQIKGAIATSHGLSANVKITDPTTGKSTIVLSDSQGIAEAIKDGLLVEYY